MTNRGSNQRFLTIESIEEELKPALENCNQNQTISRDKEGLPVSKFQDLVWDFGAYQNKHCKVDFSKIYHDDESERKSVYHAIKLCSLQFLCAPELNSVVSASLAIKQLFYFAFNAITKKISFKESLSDIEAIKEIDSNTELSHNKKYRKIANIFTAYNRLGNISARSSSFDLVPNMKAYEFALRLLRSLKKSRKVNQTPIIPPRLFSELIHECTSALSSLNQETEIKHNGTPLKLLEVIDLELKKICEIYSSRHNCIIHIDCFDQKIFKNMKSSLHHSEEQKTIWSCLRKHNIHNFHDLRSFFSYLFICSRTLILIFSGMRLDESKNVPFNGFIERKTKYTSIYFISSWTSKLENESFRSSKWVTSKHFEPINYSIQTLSKIYYKWYKGVTIDSSNEQDYPLLPSIFSTAKPSPLFQSPPFNSYNGKTGFRVSKKFTKNPERFKLTHSDFKSLLSQDYQRDWEAGGFIIGKNFPFSCHQCRRTLVVHAVKSGLVSLPTLKSNLHHLSQTMTAYYAKDASFYDRLLDTGQNTLNKSLRSLINEFREEEIYAQAQLIWEELIKTKELLFGGYGVSLQKDKDQQQLPIIFEDESKLRHAIKTGKVSYKKTPLGGCCALEPCEKSAFTSMIDCICCEYSVLNHTSISKIEKTKANLIKQQNRYSKGSPFYKHINKEIESIEKHLGILKVKYCDG